MSFFSKMERRFGRYAIHNLMHYIVILYVAGMVIQMTNPQFYIDYLMLNPGAIMKGQVWRLFTFMIWPPYYSLLSNALMIFLYYSIGMTLERVWGAFRFNVYFFMGVLGLIVASFVGYYGFHQLLFITTADLNMSLFFAYAVTFPELQFYIYFVLPIKAKWLGAFYGVISIFEFITGDVSQRCTILLSFANFILFFLMTRNLSRINPKEIKRKKEFRDQVKIKPFGKSHHKCAICGRTEEDGDYLEFRYCSKCEGDYEYCQDHLYTHQHVAGHTDKPSDNN